MSYNTRRNVGGTGGRGGTTQVNYHQSSRVASNQAPPARNPGYTTTQSASYNSSSQPAYSTQPGYSTSTAPVTQPKPIQHQPQTTPAKPPAPHTPAPAPTPTPLKQEPVTPSDTPKMDTTENGEGTAKLPFWKKKPYIKVSNKVRKARQNAKLRRILNPKNALTFLNELRPGGAKFVVREDPGWGYVASVEVDGKAFNGHALTSSKAKVQASEHALRHLLMEQMTKAQAEAVKKEENKDAEGGDDESMEAESTEEGGEPKSKKTKESPEDELPWGSLAAFALHKLFAEWQKEGSVMSQGPPQEKTIMPMKKIPDDANKRHPVMLLNQLKPNVVYSESREGEVPNIFFNITVEIDGKEYYGQGKSKKEAKKNAAKAALVPLGITYPDEDK